jgi:DNA-binding HxlR family transcriptional regulator
VEEGKAGPAPTAREITTAEERFQVRALLSRIGDAWSALVIERLALSSDPVRFNELRRRVGDISQRMLTVTLRNLERDGLVSRRVVPGSPPAVDYALSDLGRSLAVPVCALVVWVLDNRDNVEAARRCYDEQAAAHD